ncbi:hypothetical protein Tco_0351574 [Tanacetum coccineum]
MDLEDQGVIDSGCSRHMTWNMSYLTDYEEIDGGYVGFGGNPKGGKITGKCTIKTAFRVFNSRTRIVEENLHIRFSESTPNVVGTQSNGFAGTKASDKADPKSSHDDGSKPSSDDGKKVDEYLRKDKKQRIELLFDPILIALGKDVSIFDFLGADDVVGAEAEH